MGVPQAQADHVTELFSALPTLRWFPSPPPPTCGSMDAGPSQQAGVGGATLPALIFSPKRFHTHCE